MLLLRRLAGCDGLGMWCDGSAVGGNGVQRWWRQLLARWLSHAAEVGWSEFNSTYSSIGSLTNKRGSLDLSLSPWAAAATLVMLSLLYFQCMNPLEESWASQTHALGVLLLLERWLMAEKGTILVF